MVSFQALFEPDREVGGFVITFPDFGWGVSQANTEDEALVMAEDLLATMIGDHIEQSQELPVATKRRGACYRQISLPALQSAKVELYQAFRASGMRKAELGRRTGIRKSNLERLFDLRHHSRLDQLEAAFSALKKRIWFEVRDAA
ncbi:MAG: type II toxin-antitoxin system HicB family antitoxin [Bryobacterales bacterium]|nr:type II toxin-antitoxin system HicB family antitoxin [Bryobacterales bacterium]